MHLEETLKIEDEEKQLTSKIEFHRKNANDEAELLARKNAENAAQNAQTQAEEQERRAIINTMVRESSDNLKPIKNALVHFEGNSQ